MACKVFWRGAYRHTALKDLKTNISPFTNGLKVYATIDEGLSEVASARPKGVGTNGNWPWYFICFKKLDGLG